MRKFLIVAALAVLSTATGCKTFWTNQVVVDNGPMVVRSGVNVGVQWALADQKASKEDATRINSYIADARAIIANGQAPASALNDLATFLNTKITNPVIRSAIQYGIEMVKANVTIPVDGVIPVRVKTWVYAVLDGASDGCVAYIGGTLAPGVSPVRAPSTISFH